MTRHVSPSGPSVECMRDRFGECRTCDLIDREGPHYNEAYRRLYFPEEFPAEAESAPIVPRGEPPQVPHTPKHLDIPLAGDVVEAVAKRIGADRLARWWTEKTGLPCGCEARKEALNRASRTLLKWAGRTP